MARYRVMSERVVLAPFGDEVELEDEILAARLVRGGHLDIADGKRSSTPPSHSSAPRGAAAGAAPKSLSSEDTDTEEAA